MDTCSNGQQSVKPIDVLMKKSLALGTHVNLASVQFSTLMDENDPLKEFREKFYIPTKERFFNTKEIHGTKVIDSETQSDMIYLGGHSLGLQPKKTRQYLDRVLENWMDRGVESHFTGFLPSALSENECEIKMAKLIGCDHKDIAVMNGLTVNLHIMMTFFYRPTPKRHKILIEDGAFSSDMYAATSQICRNGFEANSLICLKPRKNEHVLRTEDILEIIRERGDEIELILWPGVQYYTGQKFNSDAIIKAARQKGCKIGLDLAHAVGNVHLEVGVWKPDFAVWCSYKYLNSGAGGVGGIYVNEKYTRQIDENAYLKGWWGNKLETRFEMKKEFVAADGADRFKLGNQSPFLSAALLASLEIFEEAKMENLLKKQYELTGYLEYLLRLKLPKIIVITPSDSNERGNQLSMLLDRNAKEVQTNLLKLGVICDSREPRVLRVAPCPLYNTFSDVRKFVDILSEVVQMIKIE